MSSRVSLEADSSVLLQVLCPGAEYESSRSPRWNRDQVASRTARAPPADCKHSQADVGPGWLTLMLGHSVLHVCPRKLLAAPDTDVSVTSTAQCKVQKNVAPRTGHRVSWYADTHMHVCRCETHHKLLLMRFLQKIINFDRKVKLKSSF